jgi:heme/copper-type cytochrome/quinol oxidase subunit 1
MALSTSALKIDTAFLFGVSYIFLFLVGGLTGM